MNIGAISYSISAFTFLIFLVILLTDRHRGSTKRALVIAASISCIWSFVLAYESLLSTANVQLSIIEYLKSASWVILLIQLLGVVYGDRFERKIIKKVQYVIVAVMAVLILPAFLEYLPSDVFFLNKDEYLTGLNLLMTILGIVLIEQVYRNTRTEQKWACLLMTFICMQMHFYISVLTRLSGRLEGSFTH